MGSPLFPSSGKKGAYKIQQGVTPVKKKERTTVLDESELRDSQC